MITVVHAKSGEHPGDWFAVAQVPSSDAMG